MDFVSLMNLVDHMEKTYGLYGTYGRGFSEQDDDPNCGLRFFERFLLRSCG